MTVLTSNIVPELNRECLAQVIVQQCKCLIGATCRLNRADAHALPTVYGTIERVYLVGNKLKIDIRDTATEHVQPNSKLVMKWIQNYSVYKEKPLKTVRNGWQQIVVLLQDTPPNPLDVQSLGCRGARAQNFPDSCSEMDGWKWISLAALLPPKLRNMMDAKWTPTIMFEWMVNEFPVHRCRVNTIPKALTFMLSVQGVLDGKSCISKEETMPVQVVDAVDNTTHAGIKRGRKRKTTHVVSANDEPLHMNNTPMDEDACLLLYVHTPELLPLGELPGAFCRILKQLSV
jgi:hypothetical protein